MRTTGAMARRCSRPPPRASSWTSHAPRGRSTASTARDRIEWFWNEITDSWESVRIEPHEFIEAGEHVVVPWTMHLHRARRD